MVIPQRHMAHAPDYRLSVDDQLITPTVRPRLNRLRLIDKRGMQADQLDLTLSDHDGRLAIPARGAIITVALGWRGQPLIERGSYVVDEIEHSGAPDTIDIRAASADLRHGLVRKRTQSWHGTTVGAIVGAIASRNSLAQQIAGALADTAIDHIDQTDESDANFLTRLGERFDAIAAVKQATLLFMPAGAGVTASGTPIPPITLTRRDGDNHLYSVTDRDSYSGVIAYWRDLDGADKRKTVAGTEDDAKTLRPTYASEADAMHAARAEWQRIQRGASAFELTLAEGRPALYPETPATTQGFKPPIDATDWVITEATHDLNASAYTTRLAFEVRNK